MWIACSSDSPEIYGEGAQVLDACELLDIHREVIDRAIRFAAHHHRLDWSEAEDFQSDVEVRLRENDCALLRAFEGRSSFRTFIGVVVQRMALDFRTESWGRFRASAEAKRLGKLAVDLEELLHRDGRTLDEAVTLLEGRHEGVNRASLQALAAKLPSRAPRARSIPLDEAENLPRPADNEETVLADERRRLAARLASVLSRLIAALTEEDRLIVQLRFQGGMTVVEIARSLGLDQKLTYRRIERIMRELKRQLENERFTSREISDLIGHGEIFIHLDFGNSIPRPSMSNDERTGPYTEEP